MYRYMYQWFHLAIQGRICQEILGSAFDTKFCGFCLQRCSSEWQSSADGERLQAARTRARDSRCQVWSQDKAAFLRILCLS